MYPRQIWLFKVGCWTALVSAVLHLVGALVGFGRLNEAALTAPEYHFSFPGGVDRSLLDLTVGFSLASVVLLAGIGAIGLAVVKRGYEDEPLMLGVARAAAVTGTALVGIAIAYFFVVPAMFVALMTVCFTLASVRPPAPEA
jgi:hypothetical protein